MCSVNRSDRLTLDAFADPGLTGPTYSRFTNRLSTPLINVKGVQLVNLDTINSSLQLNDENGQLMFWFYVGTTSVGVRSLGNLRCVRLHPSWYIPKTGFVGYVRNAYFNSGGELAAALNLASSTDGDTTQYNPMWVGDGIVSFAYDTASRRFSITSLNAFYWIGLAAGDDPNVLDALRGTTYPTLRVKMNGYTSTNSYSTATFQPYFETMTMNARLGYSLKYNQRGQWFKSVGGLDGIAQATGVPITMNDPPIQADTPPILLGVQNIGVYLSIATGGGMDSRGRKNLIGTVPMESAPYGVQAYTMCSVEVPSLSTANEIYEVTVELIADNGAPFNVWSNTNTSVGLVLYY